METEFVMKKSVVQLALIGIMIFITLPAFAAESPNSNPTAVTTNNIQKLEDIEVKGNQTQNGIEITPQSTNLDIESYEIVGTPQNITDLLKDNAIIDFRGESDIVPSNDTIYMRGFDTRRFVVAVDGLAIEKSGNGYGNYGVDYAILSLGQLESIEIMPGPHSALYPGQSIGGVINMVTKTPERPTPLKPELNLMSSLLTYNTQNHSAKLDGGAGNFVYGFYVQNYHTDGYLRHNEADVETYAGRVGYLLPAGGYISISASFTEQDREIAICNDPNIAGYDPDYPVVDEDTNSYEESDDPYYNKSSQSYRLKFHQPSNFGTWYLGAYYNEEQSDRYIAGVRSWDVIWSQYGGKLENEFTLFDNHMATIGVEEVQAFNESSALDRHKRMDRTSVYIQDKWQITSRARWTLGARYEDVDTWISNINTRTGGYTLTDVPKDYIDRNFSGFAPKTFFTYDLDDIAPSLRETSVSVGVSRIWHAPTSGMDMHSSGKSGFFLDEEHGIGYDLVVTRRLWRDINMKINYAFYEIEDFIAWNHSFSESVYEDKINLERVQRHGVEVELNGSLYDRLSFYVSYAYQEFENKGSELAGTTELDDRAKNRVNAGLRYRMAENTMMLIDYKHQSKQVAENAEEDEDTGEWTFTAVPMDAYHVFDFGIQHTFCRQCGYLKNPVLRICCNNIFDEKYTNTRGYLMTDQTFGASLSVTF